MLELPPARGEVSDGLLRALRGRPPRLGRIALPESEDPLNDEDLQLALYCCYELHYRGLPDVDERWEWSPSLIELRGLLEERFEHALNTICLLYTSDAADE